MKREHTTPTTQAVQNAERFLRFAVDFAQTDLGGLREGEWALVREDFEALFRSRGSAVAPVLGKNGGYFMCVSPESPPPEAFTPDDFQALQDQVRVIVHNRVLGRGVAGQLGNHLLLLGESALGIQASVADAFCCLLVFLLHQEPVNRIRACPHCGRLFVRVKQQVYCSHTCATRTAHRRFRERQAAPA